MYLCISKFLDFNFLNFFKGGTVPLGIIFEDFVHFLKKINATLDKVSYGSGQKCSKELKNYSFTSAETIVVNLQWKMCEKSIFSMFWAINQ